MMRNPTKPDASRFSDTVDVPNSRADLNVGKEYSSCDSTIVSAQYKTTKIIDSFNCLQCHKRFTQKSTYQNHLRIHEKQETNIYPCNICNKSFSIPARLTRHYRTHTGEKPYQCEYCTKSFSVKENLSVHRRIHTKERPYKCDVCQSRFEHSGKLHRHMRIHTGERPHKCSICDKTFIQSGQLIIHMRTHTGEKPYLCKSCGKGFTCSKQLKVHTRTHTGEKPYKCDICGKSFGYNHVLKLHQVAHYGEKFYKCVLCHKSFNSKKLMEMHVKSSLNCEIHDVTKFDSRIPQTMDETEEIMPYHSRNLNLASQKTRNKKKYISTHVIEKIIPYETHGSDKKIERSNYYVPHQNSKNVSIQIPTENLDEQNTTSDLMEEDSSFSLICRHPPVNLNEFDSHTLKMNEFTFMTPIISPAAQFTHSKFQEIILSEPESTRNSTLQENLARCYENISQGYSMNSPLCTTELDIVISSSKNNLILPPRKRCKIIWESYLSGNREFKNPNRCNSVIKFAKIERTI